MIIEDSTPRFRVERSPMMAQRIEYPSLRSVEHHRNFLDGLNLPLRHESTRKEGDVWGGKLSLCCCCFFGGVGNKVVHRILPLCHLFKIQVMCFIKGGYVR